MDAYEQALYGMAPSYQLTEEEKKALKMQQLIATGAALMAGRGNFVNNLGQAMLVGQNQGSEGMQDLRRNKLAESQMQMQQMQIADKQREYQAAQAAAAKAQAEAERIAAVRKGAPYTLPSMPAQQGPTPNTYAAFGMAPPVQETPKAQSEYDRQMALYKYYEAQGIDSLAKEHFDRATKVRDEYGLTPIEITDNGKPRLAQVSKYGGHLPLDVTPRPKIGAVSPGDYTGEQLARFSASGGDWNTLGRPIDKRNISNTQVHVAPGQAEWDKTIQKSMGDQYTQIQAAAKISREKLSNLETINDLLQGATTGGFTPAMTKVANAAESFGIKLDPNLGPKQAADMLSKQSALLSRNPAGGAGMPGNLSNKDLDFLVEMTPGLYQSAEGRRIHMETQRRLAKRDAWIARQATKYRMDEVGFSTKLQDEIDQYDANMNFKDLADQARALPSVGGGQRKREQRN